MAILDWTKRVKRAYNATISKKQSRKSTQSTGASMKKDTQYEVGQEVEFTGYTGSELPDNNELLEEGVIYPIIEATPSDSKNEEFYTVGVINEDFDAKKRKTKNNREYIGVEVYADEFDTVLEEEVEDEEIEEEIEEPEDEIEDELEEEVEEEHVPKPKTKPKAKAKPAARAKEKSKAKPKAKAKAKVKPAKTKPVKAIAKTKPVAKSKSKLKEADPELAQDPENVDLIILTEEEEDAEVLELVKGTEDICALVEDMQEESSNINYIRGGLLYHVHKSKAYKELDPRYAELHGFATYVDERLGIRYRTAMNEIGVYTMFSRFGLDRADYIRLGPTKCTEIERAATEDNIDDLLRLAGESTVMEIKDSIKESYVSESGEIKKVKRVSFKFMLHEDQGATVRTLFEEAKQALGLESDEDVFESIVTEWAMDHLNVKKSRTKAKTSTRGKAKATVDATA
jgi:hypothetical protein